MHDSTGFGDDLFDHVVIDGISLDGDLDALGLLVNLVQCAVHTGYAFNCAKPLGQLNDRGMMRLQYIEYESFYVAHLQIPFQSDKLDLQY